MAALVLVVRRRVCLYASCGRVFYICVHCDRGQVCCGERCRYKHRRAQCREANRFYQGKPKGKRAHSKRQEAYRLRQALARAKISTKKVTDQGLYKQGRFASVSMTEAMMSPFTNESRAKGKTREEKTHNFARCCICGQCGFVSREGDIW
jgi:hypothetical protein